jgi:hypothetical protein
MTETSTNLWSLRWSVGYGNHYALERACHLSTANDWLNVFRSSEPDVSFVLSKRKPKAPKNAF